jgi:hypothetical protein
LLIPRALALLPSSNSASDRPVLALTYHPHNLPAVKIVRRNFHILLTDPSTRDISPDPPLVAFRRDRNLRDLLIHSRLLGPQDAPRGTSPYGRPCLTCSHTLLTDTLPFPLGSFTTQGSYSCTTRNVVYAIVCMRCQQKYIGETGLTLGERFAQHLWSVAQDSGVPVANHFNLPQHSKTDMRITVLEVCFSRSRDRYLLENRLILRLGVNTPHGVNTMHSFI